MGTASPYRWDFSVDSRESVKDSVTFSVGIYQWIPKNGRNGLKKSKTIRVTGYVADPTSLYAKAEELCALFNAEAFEPIRRQSGCRSITRFQSPAI